MKRIKNFKLVLLLGVLFLTVQCGQYQDFFTNVFRSDVFHQLYDTSDYDFLWVFDNSDSMADKRQYVKDNLQSFLNTLQSRKAIDYQMAIVTTDFFTHAGQLVKSPSGQEVVYSSSADPVADFASIINNVQQTPQSFWEQGLESAYQAVAAHGSKFVRPGVPLIIIFLSDEDDYSCAADCYGVEPEHNDRWTPFEVDRYINFFKTLKGDLATVSVFPIVGTDESSCSVPSFGLRYMDLQAKSGGFGENGSICLRELPDSYQNIAQVIADKGVRFTLSTPAKADSISVFVDQEKVEYSATNGFTFDEERNAILFTGDAVPSNGSIIEVVYAEDTN